MGDWQVRDMQAPIPIAGGDGFALPLTSNLPDNSPNQHDQDDDDIWANTGVGEPVDATHSQALGESAARGPVSEGAYQYTNFLKTVSHLVTHSLGREILYNWADAQFNVGGVGSGYPLDYGFGPGAHYDCTPEQGNVQLYMKPGIYRPPGR
jgi:hypothetical protein